jgi:N-acetylmuramoyl-L-alanine amidase
MLLRLCEDCATKSAIGLDRQLLYQINKISPGALVRIDDIPNLSLGNSVLPWLQPDAKKCLIAAIKERGKTMKVNSAYRTIVAQQLLRSHYENRRCNIVAAAPPGESNHNNASAIDVEDSHGWQPYLERNGWKKLGTWDDMHFDCIADGISTIKSLSVQAFQQIWNLANPGDRLSVDGDLGQLVGSRLRSAPIEGFNLPDGYPARIMRLTEPLQAGNDIGNLQLQLRSAGVKLQKADKIFGVDTDLAVRTYQSNQGLFADGIVGQDTSIALFDLTTKNIA